MVIVSILLILLVTGVALGFWANHENEGSRASGNKAATSTLHLESFVLNTGDSDQRAYLRVGIDLGLNQDNPRRSAEAVPTAQVRDTILGVLAEAKLDDLMTSTGKRKLKEEIARALRDRLPELGVEEVYFTEFLIQR
ncbi:MAG TPA: flagellar basal body-associated FliL family protein [Candidatus Binatia bacterium]|nr:flagellar basal body-associated FliL family protein [Candidatus Binatia bacterium]